MQAPVYHHEEIKNLGYICNVWFLFFTHERKNEIWNWTFFFVLQCQKWKTKINSIFNFRFCDSKLKYENRFHILIMVFVNKKIKNQKLTRFSYFDLLFWGWKQKTSCILFFSISAQNWKSNDTKSPYNRCLLLRPFEMTGSMSDLVK